MGGYPGSLPVELSGTSPVREFGFGSWCSAQLLSRVVLGGGLLRVGRVVEQLAELLVRDFSWTVCIALWHWYCFRGTVVCSLGIMFRLPAVGLGDS